MTTLQEKIKELSDEELIQLSKDIQKPTVSDSALIRTVIKDTENDSTLPVLAFIAVGTQLAIELGERFEQLVNRVGYYQD